MNKGSLDNYLSKQIKNDLRDEIFRAHIFGRPFEPAPDCNRCMYINLTEREQQYTPGIHKCIGYGKRLHHRAITKIHDDFIYPCEECVRDGYKGFKLSER